MNPQGKKRIRKMVRTHLKNVKMFRELGFHYEAGQFVIPEEVFFND